jgi:hypothetical protein
MNVANAVRIANERRALAGLPPLTVIQSKNTPEYCEVYRIMNESLYTRIHSILSMPRHQAERKAELRTEMAGRVSGKIVSA